jgi:hypothetical protein
MIDKKYLLAGLNGLSRAHETNYFTDGHRAAAIISAHYLCRETPLSESASAIIERMIDEHWIDTPLFAPFADEPVVSSGIERILETVERNITGLRQAGHNVIFPSLALKAFRDVPEALTPARVQGICRLVDSFDQVDDEPPVDGGQVPAFDAPAAAAPFVLTELLRTMVAFDGRGQGWSGHLLTYSRALLDLHELGYTATAKRAERGLRRYVHRIRRGPQETDKPRPEHAEISLRPHEHAYWQERQSRPLSLGHVFKYPYGFYGLMTLTDDLDLKARCMGEAYRIF